MTSTERGRELILAVVKMRRCVYVCVYGYQKLVVVKRTNDQGNLITN